MTAQCFACGATAEAATGTRAGDHARLRQLGWAQVVKRGWRCAACEPAREAPMTPAPIAEITLGALRAHLRAASDTWQARTTDETDDDSHLTAWAWVEAPDAVELAGDRVQVRHATHTRGAWLTVRPL